MWTRSVTRHVFREEQRSRCSGEMPSQLLFAQTCKELCLTKTGEVLDFSEFVFVVKVAAALVEGTRSCALHFNEKTFGYLLCVAAAVDASE